MVSRYHLIVLLAAATIALAELPPGVLKKISKPFEICSKKHGTSKDHALKLLEDMKLPDTPEMKCTFDCYFVEVGYLKDGKMDFEEVIASHYEEYPNEPAIVEIVNKIALICKDTVKWEGLKFCEFSETLLSCIYENSKKV